MKPEKNTFIDIHTHRVLSGAGYAIYNYTISHEPVSSTDPYSVGIHPWYIREDQLENDLSELIKLATSDRCIAIGEIGLDKLQGPAINIQTEVLQKQIKIAEEVDKPIIIHCVRAHQEFLSIKPNVPAIIHGFNQSVQIGEKLLEQGYFLSFGAALLRPDSNASKMLAAYPLGIPFFLETDHKGVAIEEIYQKAAMIRNLHLGVLKTQIADYFLRLFYL